MVRSNRGDQGLQKLRKLYYRAARAMEETHMKFVHNIMLILENIFDGRCYVNNDVSL